LIEVSYEFPVLESIASAEYDRREDKVEKADLIKPE
jgi:hypothetical protein